MIAGSHTRFVYLACDGEVVRLTEAEVTLMRRLARSAHEPVDRLELARDTADATGRARHDDRTVGRG